jgi:hypothetical protein
MLQQSQAFSPVASSLHTLAQYRNPFGFSLQVTESGETLTIVSDGINVAQLVVPSAPVSAGVSTGNLADLVISFQNQTLQSLNNDAFEAFFAAVTDTASVQTNLTGSANIVGRTAIGDVPIQGVPFNVITTLAGTCRNLLW